MNIIQYTSGGEPIARVPKVARETISRGTPRLENLLEILAGSYIFISCNTI